MALLAKVALFALLLAQTYARSPVESRLNPVEREAVMREMEEEARKHSIVTYSKEKVKEDGGVENLKKQVEEKCGDCKIRELKAIGAFILDWESAEHAAAADMMDIPDVDHATEDLVVFMDSDQERQTSTPNDPRFSDQWALQSLANNADINWLEGVQAYLSDSQGASPNGPDVIVAVIDTGIDYTHNDIKDVMWTNPDDPVDGVDNDNNGIVDDVYGADFTNVDPITGEVTPTNNPIDRHGHGTHCAGVIASPTGNNLGIAGIAGVSQGKVKVMAIKGLSDQGAGSLAGLMTGLNYAIEKGAKISSNSWGGGTTDGGVLGNILNNVPSHLFIAAAGNEGRLISSSRPSVTCSTNAPNQICVGSSNSSDAKSSFSNYGLPFVHVMAPGSSIMSTLPNNRYSSWSGTSMACPQVSGLAALVSSMRTYSNGAELKQLIEANVQPKSDYTDKVSSGGLIDVLATVQAASGGPAPTSAPTGAPTAAPTDAPTAPPTNAPTAPPTGAPTTASPPGDNVCTDIKIVTKEYGYENSWTFGSCSSNQEYGDDQQYTVQCCQPAGNYELTCKCSYGDGWHGGYIQIGGEKYCDDFDDGFENVVDDIAQGEDGGDGGDGEMKCITIKTQTRRYGFENSWTFGSCSSDQEYESKERYEQECCQPAGSYDLVCECSYGDGWHGGYVQIGDSNKRLCRNFRDGESQTVEGVEH